MAFSSASVGLLFGIEPLAQFLARLEKRDELFVDIDQHAGTRIAPGTRFAPLD